MSKRVIIILVVFIGCATGSYYLFKPNPIAQTDQALSALQENNVAAAQEALKTLSAQPMAYPLTLYKGYLEQARGRYLESDLYFHSLLKNPPKKLREAVKLEALLAQASNAFFQQRDQDISPLVDSAQLLAPHNPFVFFFKGLNNYLRADYGEALKAWSAFNPTEPTEGTGWMATVVERLFPLTWRQLHVAHCLTEEGDLLSGREILEKESHQMDSQELTNLATLFLGLTYLKEADHIPIDQRGSYYKLARFYFERSGTKELHQRERKLITPHVQKEAEGLLLTSLDDEKAKWGFDFVHTLLEWKANTAVESIAEELAYKMLSQKGEEDVKLCQSIRQEFLGSPFHVLLTQKLLDAMAHGLKRGETEDLHEVWSMVETLSPSPTLLAKQIASLTSEEIFRTVKRDNNSLLHTRRYLAFWEKLGRSTQERESLAQELFLHAQLFWQQEHQEKKGERLMDIAQKLCSNKVRMDRQIGEYLGNLYTKAENSNMIGRLMLIFDAMDRFQINKQELANPSKMANHLADAEYLYDAHNYSLSKAHAMWVLKLDPDNESAQRLVGLSSFHLGEYSRALCALKTLDNPDEDARKALMLSQVFASQEQEKHLCQIDNIDSFEEDE
ncbi:MAG: hypothetical protein S4CHLAM2_03370 [Chlamydiales bacterium]|nr:hypothetical protein [Chlamydiales bacterium]